MKNLRAYGKGSFRLSMGVGTLLGTAEWFALPTGAVFGEAFGMGT